MQCAGVHYRNVCRFFIWSIEVHVKTKLLSPNPVPIRLPNSIWLLGLAELVIFIKMKISMKQNVLIVTGVTLGIFGRFVSMSYQEQSLAEYSGGKNPWLYSIDIMRHI